MVNKFILSCCLFIPYLGFGQLFKFEVIEKDSMVWVYDTVKLNSSLNLFEIIFESPVNNYPHHLHFVVQNNSSDTMVVNFGTEGVMLPALRIKELAPQECYIAIYRFNNVRQPGSNFSQVGRIYGRPADDFEHSFYCWFMISGTWAY